MKDQINININGITYIILAEENFEKGSNIDKVCDGYYVSMLMLRRQKGTKTFNAMRDENGVVTLN